MAHLTAGAFEAITCGALLSEVARVTLRPHLAARIPPGDRDEILDLIVNRTRFVPGVPPQPAVPADPADDYLVAIAREWGAALVTGDQHLLNLPAMPTVVSPRQFLRLLA